MVEAIYSNGLQKYDMSSDSWSSTTIESWKDNYSGTAERLSIISTDSGKKRL